MSQANNLLSDWQFDYSRVPPSRRQPQVQMGFYSQLPQPTGIQLAAARLARMVAAAKKLPQHLAEDWSWAIGKAHQEALQQQQATQALQNTIWQRQLGYDTIWSWPPYNLRKSRPIRMMDVMPRVPFPAGVAEDYDPGIYLPSTLHNPSLRGLRF